MFRHSSSFLAIYVPSLLQFPRHLCSVTLPVSSLSLFRLRTIPWSLIFAPIIAGARRCFSCRSRGKLGDCRDTFPYNATYLVKDVEAVPCASGWCSKIIEGDKYGEGMA
ncbi:hypothetical protein HAZT_HAZT001848 [Hyalella azteca]|uniref:Protein sleepless n=1 Tax=Hyalella azteca TaxID=294128 RepID=A0A6A0GVI9_HYAAZ|nr:hypothetical protein HAZT_HAZT001848 [Hyalella azteca]